MHDQVIRDKMESTFNAFTTIISQIVQIISPRIKILYFNKLSVMCMILNVAFKIFTKSSWWVWTKLTHLA